MADKPKKLRPKKEEQAERFIATAKEIKADETGAKFEAAFKRIVPKKGKKA